MYALLIKFPFSFQLLGKKKDIWWHFINLLLNPTTQSVQGWVVLVSGAWAPLAGYSDVEGTLTCTLLLCFTCIQFPIWEVLQPLETHCCYWGLNQLPLFHSLSVSKMCCIFKPISGSEFLSYDSILEKLTLRIGNTIFDLIPNNTRCCTLTNNSSSSTFS